MITKEAEDKRMFINTQYFYNSARYGFEYLLSKLFTDKSQKILMPGYIGESAKEGSGVFDPIRNLNLNFEFYRLNSNLSIDIDDFTNKIKNNNIKVALIIHYFGFPQKDIQCIVNQCKELNVLLIEDCAHSLHSSFQSTKLGNFGDFSFSSIHKLIATQDGGILQINNEKYLSLISKSSENISEDTLDVYRNTDVIQTSLIRRKNYNLYLDKLNSQSGLFDILYAKLEEGVVPLNFPILIKNYSREKYYYELIDKGIITVSLYYSMISELSKAEFPISYDISSKILNLPVHQDITESDIDQIVKVLNAS